MSMSNEISIIDRNHLKQVSIFESIRDDAERDALIVKDYVITTEGSYQYYQYMIKSILRVFDEGIEKLKYALVLPYLIDEQCELEEYLSSDLFKLINSYCEKSFIAKLIEKHDVENITPGTGIQTVNLDFQILEAIEILQNNKDIRANLNKYLEKTSEIADRILNTVSIIQQVAATRLWVAVLSTEANESRTPQKNHDVDKTRKYSSQATALHDMEENLKRKIQAKQELVNTYQNELSNQKKQLNVKKNKAIINAHNQIEDICNKNESNRIRLEEEIQDMQAKYKKYQTSNIQTEKKIRERKKRFYLQLQTWIKKYEDDVTAKVQEHYRIDEEIDQEQNELDKFMLIFNIQEVEYLHLWRKKQAEKELALRKRIQAYEKNRAARTLQRYWRLFLQKKKKKRGGKGKNKK